MFQYAHTKHLFSNRESSEGKQLVAAETPNCITKRVRITKVMENNTNTCSTDIKKTEGIDRIFSRKV